MSNQVNSKTSPTVQDFSALLAEWGLTFYLYKSATANKGPWNRMGAGWGAAQRLFLVTSTHKETTLTFAHTYQHEDLPAALPRILYAGTSHDFACFGSKLCCDFTCFKMLIFCSPGVHLNCGICLTSSRLSKCSMSRCTAITRACGTKQVGDSLPF